MKKVLIISSFAPALVKFRGDLIKDFQKNKFEVYVILPDGVDQEYIDMTREFGVNLHLVPMQRTGLNPFSDIKTLFSLYKTIKKIKPDIVLSNIIKSVIYGSIAAKLASVKSINSLISGLGYAFIGTSLKNRIVNLIGINLYRFSLIFNKIVFFQNSDDLNLFIDKKIISNKDKCRIVNGSGVNTEFFPQKPLPDKISFLLIARLLKDKGIYEYIEAVKKVKNDYPEIIFKLVGWIDSNPAAIAQKDLDQWQKEGLVKYYGRLLDVRDVLAGSSVFVLPSYREGTPRTVLEAMSTGRPIITTDAPGCRETVVDGDNGFLVPVKDSEVMAERMIELIKNESLVKTMATRSRQIAEEKYDVRKVNKEMISILQATLP